jgi:uncharacterized protein YcbX
MARGAPAGVVASIHRYPVKSMMGEELEATHISAKGLQGDRACALADVATGKVASAKNPAKWPDLFQFRAAFTKTLKPAGRLPPVRITFPEGGTALSDDCDLDSLLSARLGKPVRFLRGAPPSSTLEEYWPDITGLARRDVITDEAMPAGSFFDCAPIHVVTTGTLESLQTLYPAGRFDPCRFRPNLVIETLPGGGRFPEQDWNERILRVGAEVAIKITGPCGRCVMTTLPQAGLPKDTGILKTAVDHNHAWVGVYASVIRGGIVRQGDSVTVESVGSGHNGADADTEA